MREARPLISENVEESDKIEEKLEEEASEEGEDWDHGKFSMKKYEESLLTSGRSDPDSPPLWLILLALFLLLNSTHLAPLALPAPPAPPAPCAPQQGVHRPGRSGGALLLALPLLRGAGVRLRRLHGFLQPVCRVLGP